MSLSVLWNLSVILAQSWWSCLLVLSSNILPVHHLQGILLYWSSISESDKWLSCFIPSLLVEMCHIYWSLVWIILGYLEGELSTAVSSRPKLTVEAAIDLVGMRNDNCSIYGSISSSLACFIPLCSSLTSISPSYQGLRANFRLVWWLLLVLVSLFGCWCVLMHICDSFYLVYFVIL